MGAFAAAELARRADPLRAPVVVLEPGDFEAAAAASVPVVPGGVSDGALRPALVDGDGVISKFETVIGRGIGFGRPGLLDWTASGDADSAQSMRAAAHALGLDASLLIEANWQPRAGAIHASRLHDEVLALARTRGAITRAHVEVQSLKFDESTGQVCGVETSGGSYAATQVLICDFAAAKRLVPLAAAHISAATRLERHFPSPEFEVGAMPLGNLRGPVKDLFETNLDIASEDPFRTFFGGDEVLEYPFPSLRTDDFDVLPNPLDSNVVVVERKGTSTEASLRENLRALAPAFESLAPESGQRKVHLIESADGLPVVGPMPDHPGVFVAFGLGIRAAQIAAGLAPGIAAQMRGDAVAAFDTALLAVR